MITVCGEAELYRCENGLALGVSPVPRPRGDADAAPPREETDDAQEGPHERQ